MGYPELSSRTHNGSDFAYRYDLGKKSFGSVPPIRDWYLASQLNYGFTYQSLETVESLYQEFVVLCEEEAYLKVLEPKYQQATKLTPGQPAPDIELKDLEGNWVRISDFKGKIIYMDFWGIGCGPCIYEFENSKAEFQQKYGNQDIVFIYVNVSDQEDDWKKGVEKYKLDGVNLIAEGWNKHPACQAYNVKGIPHYVLIDKEGNIVNNKCDQPSMLLMRGENNELEKLLQRYK